MPGPDLPYLINDADNHFNEPLDLYERYIDPKHKDLAIRQVTDDDGRSLQLFAGRPSRFSSEQITVPQDQLDKLLDGGGQSDAAGGGAKSSTPGMLLNRLNPLKGLTVAERDQMIAEFRTQRESYGNRDLRLALMDDQGIHAALMFPASAHDIEYELADDVDAIYANARAFNRWIHEEIGYAHANRMFLPPYISLADVQAAVGELDTVLGQGAPVIQLRAGHAHGGRSNPFGGRSLADPMFDPLWSRINDAGARVAIHLGATDYQKHGAEWSEDPQDTFGRFDAFQWVFYWGDRPAMETVGGMILHGLFSRFPNVRVCLSEQGTVWVPYLVRKMDHAFLMGRKARWGTLDKRPSDIFREHFIVAPYPEENVGRVVSVVGPQPIVFGSDFPHGEGLAFPREYVAAQLGDLDDRTVKAIMHDNLADFLGLPA